MSLLTEQEIAKQSARIDSLTSAGAEYQRQCFEQAERIKELEKKAELPMKYKRMQFNAELQEEVKKQAAEISRLREVLAKCKVALTGMKDWFDAEENHGSTTFYERVEMCNAVQINTKEALAAIKEIES